MNKKEKKKFIEAKRCSGCSKYFEHIHSYCGIEWISYRKPNIFYYYESCFITNSNKQIIITNYNIKSMNVSNRSKSLMQGRRVYIYVYCKRCHRRSSFDVTANNLISNYRKK